jgi:hypothetical protein
LESAYLIDAYAEGKDTGNIGLFLVGNINHYHRNDLVEKLNAILSKKSVDSLVPLLFWMQPFSFLSVCA